jgi:GntR family transcriptional regulator/MocR family aminotransferase
MAGLEPVPIPVDADGLDVQLLAERAVDAVLVAPAHSYPTGATLHPRRRHELIAWARRADALILEDDYDAELRYDRAPIGALQGTAPDRVAYLGSFSKTLTPALRLGWIVAPAHLASAVAREKRYDDVGSSLLEQLALERLIDSGDFARHLRRIRPIYRDRRDAALAGLAELLPEATWHGASAGLHLHLTLDPDVDVAALAVAAYDRGVLIENAALHWADPGQAPPSLVLGYAALSKAAFRRALAELAAALADVS